VKASGKKNFDEHFYQFGSLVCQANTNVFGVSFGVSFECQKIW
jgi:hypothetical protein